ncbi:MAG: DUF6323 family protein, partial [Lachnospiraceae bacterium]|nr:DUF6323 family protein [Lachnospiraceae bacterium]
MEEEQMHHWLWETSKEQFLLELEEKNEKSKRFGLTLTKEDARLLAKERIDELQEQQRVEFGGGILPKIIDFFCDSPYIFQSNYVDTLVRLQEIFYLYKNESMDLCTDDELLECMKEAFDGVCQGSLEYLEETAL